MSQITADLRVLEVDQGYSDFEKLVKERLESQKGPFFTTANSIDLIQLYLANLPSNKQHYNCNCCKNFIYRFGGLVTIDSTGIVESAIWPKEVPEFFQSSVDHMRKYAVKQRITGVFLSDEREFGTASSKKGWTHLHAHNPDIFTHKLQTSYQRSAELKEDYALVQRTLQEYTLNVVENAVTILNTGIVAGEEKGKKIAEWYLALLCKYKDIKNSWLRENIVWLAVATAPSGFAHLGNGMVGTLLKDLKSGKDFNEVKASWEAKMHPLKYRRPTAEVSDNQINEAEKLVEKLGISRSFQRRFAVASELKHVIWMPRGLKNDEFSGVFGSVRKVEKKVLIDIPNRNMSWNVFQRDILPTVNALEIMLPSRGDFMGMTTAVHADAPPILQWDREDDRNPVSYYIYFPDSYAYQWRVMADWNRVDRITLAPHGNDLDHHMKFIFFNIEAMMDQKGNQTGSALFPDTFKSELRTVEKVVEKYSKANNLEGTGNANGYPFMGKNPVQLRVNGNATYTLDRWE